MNVQLGEQHVYPTPSLIIAAPRAVELTVIEDDFCLSLAFSAALFISGLYTWFSQGPWFSVHGKSQTAFHAARV